MIYQAVWRKWKRNDAHGRENDNQLATREQPTLILMFWAGRPDSTVVRRLEGLLLVRHRIDNIFEGPPAYALDMLRGNPMCHGR